MGIFDIFRAKRRAPKRLEPSNCSECGELVPFGKMAHGKCPKCRMRIWRRTGRWR